MKCTKVNYCQYLLNRLVNNSFGKEKYKNIKNLEWNYEELKYGKILKIKDFTSNKKVKQILGNFPC